jgi:hypothetical protein
MSILKSFRKKDHAEVIHYVVLIEAPLEIVGAQLSAWFNNAWRPSESSLMLKCPEEEAVKAGAICRAELTKFLKVSWQMEVAKIVPDHFVISDLTGFFTGTETVTVEERDNGIKVDYRMAYEFKNPIHQIMWSLWMEDAFIHEVRKSMDALKSYCEKVK